MEDVDDKGDEEYLRYACAKKHDEAIRYLIEEWEYDLTNPVYLCWYCLGIEECSYETFEYFLARGANPYAKADNGKCAMDYLREESSELADNLAELAKKYGYEE